MDTNLEDKESFVARIQQLEHERDGLRKDIEQLCMQQAGPSYVAVATRMHFQRTAGLEQEIENLKKKLAACTRDNINLQEELSEAYRIKSQLADLHRAEVEKAVVRLVALARHMKNNMEAEKLVKFFQGCVASAFAERDQSIMEAEKAKEKEELISQKFREIENGSEELTSECVAYKKLNDELRVDLAKLDEHSETLKQVVNKFYEIRQHSLEACKDTSWDDQCACLLLDSSELWSYNDTSTLRYISGLEEELEMVKKSMDNLQSKLRVGLEIEKHLKKRVCELEKKQILSDKMIVSEIARIRDCHSRYRDYIMKLLSEEKSHFGLVINMVEEKARQIDANSEQTLKHYREAVNSDENECRDVHISTDAVAELVSKRDDHAASLLAVEGEGNNSEVLSQALQEKVAALLLLSQQEERHLLERNVNAALQKKVEELQRNLLQVTNEKVKALMELAHLKHEYQQLQERIGPEIKKRSPLTNIMVKSPFNLENDGKLKNLLKKTYLKHWIGGLDFSGNEAGTHHGEGNFSARRSNSLDFARMKIENATLKESMESMEHLISSIHRLRLALLKVKESVTCEDNVIGMSEELDIIISEAKLVKTALGTALPISWSAEADDVSIGDSVCNEPGEIYEVPISEKKDFVSAAGFEMVELLILAAQMLKDDKTILSSQEGRR